MVQFCKYIFTLLPILSYLLHIMLSELPCFQIAVPALQAFYFWRRCLYVLSFRRASWWIYLPRRVSLKYIWWPYSVGNYMFSAGTIAWLSFKVQINTCLYYRLWSCDRRNLANIDRLNLISALMRAFLHKNTWNWFFVIFLNISEQWRWICWQLTLHSCG